MSRCEHRMSTSVGTLEIRIEDGLLREIRFAAEPAAQAAPGCACQAAREQLAQYFAGDRQVFELPMAPEGTAFQRRVWEELSRIPYGATISYAELAARLDNAGAVRAVGRANGQNPIPIIIPCHRVIGADGTLTGYGGGLPIKETLLRLEGALPPQQLALL